MATRGALTVKMSMTCDTSRVLGLLCGFLWGHSRPLGTPSSRWGPLWCRDSPWPPRARETCICSSFGGALGWGSVHWHPPLAGHVVFGSGLAESGHPRGGERLHVQNTQIKM
eukprot:6236594-Pyramimonas_sp.AAC.1